MENHQAKIVVVDDDLQFRSITAKLIAHRIGETVASFESGDELLNHLRTMNHVDIILSDINMPRMTGFELLGLIKEQFPDKKCVMMSGDPKNEKEALDNGADAYINKPFQIQEITALLKRLTA